MQIRSSRSPHDRDPQLLMSLSCRSAVQKYFILKSILKILFYFVFSKYFLGVFCTSLSVCFSYLLFFTFAVDWMHFIKVWNAPSRCRHCALYVDCLCGLLTYCVISCCIVWVFAVRMNWCLFCLLAVYVMFSVVSIGLLLLLYYASGCCVYIVSRFVF